jgi:hypothetical protein
MSESRQPLFPKEFVNPSTKENKKFGIEYAEAIYYSSHRHGARLIDSDSEYNDLMEFAQGRQSVDRIKNILGHFESSNPETDAESLDYIDIQVLNLAPKYINKIVGKLRKLRFHARMSIIDAKSINEEKEFKNKVRAYYDLKNWYDKIGVPAEKLFSDLPIDVLPEEPDELIYMLSVNPKVRKAIKCEKTLKLLHYINNWDQIWRECDWDMVVFGKAYVHNYLDHNLVPRQNRVSPQWAIHPYSESESWDDLEYFAYIDFITANQFCRESKFDLTPQQQLDTIGEFGKPAKYHGYEIPEGPRSYDGLDYIPVLRFYFISEDSRHFEKKRNQYNNPIIVKRPFDYAIEESATPEPNLNKLITTRADSLYGGNWVVGSQVCYGYGRKEWPRSNLVNIRPPIIGYAPNYKEGRVVSLTSQMVEPIFMINMLWSKVKAIFARGFMGIREIDFNQMENVAMGKGGKQWTPRQVYEHLLKQDTLIKRGKTTKYDQNYGPAIMEGRAGLMLTDYMNQMQMSFKILDELAGSPSYEGSEPPERLAVSVMQQNRESTFEALEPLFNGHTKLYLESNKTLFSLAQLAQKNGTILSGYIADTGEYFETDNEIADVDVGLMLEKEPPPEEWNTFYQQMIISLENQMIQSSDVAMILEMTSIREARQMLAVKELKYEKKRAKMAKAAEESQIRISQAASEGRTMENVTKIREKGSIDKEIALLQGMINEKLKQMEIDSMDTKENKRGETAREVASKAAQSKVLSQALRNQVERIKVDKRPDKSPQD